MSADAIAAVMASFKRHRVDSFDHRTPVMTEEVDEIARSPIIDATAIYSQLYGPGSPVLDIAAYELDLHPPMENFVVAHVNRYGNVQAVHCQALRCDEMEWDDNVWRLGNRRPVRIGQTADSPEYSMHDGEWFISLTYFVGGYSDTAKANLPTTGPVHLVGIPVDKEGHALDIRWFALGDSEDNSYYEACTIVTLKAIDFLNCRNVELVEPARDRAQRRRLARYGVQPIKELQVFKLGKSYRSQGERRPGDGVPLTSVRGHHAHYGPEYDRKLLFGKYAGRFWIPAHARGDADIGESPHDYTLKGEE